MERKVFFIEGDGVGPEVWRASKPVIDAALRLENSIPIAWEELLAGEKAAKEVGEAMPLDTLRKLKDARWAIKGPLGTPVGSGMRSLNVALRQGLDLYACIRPIRYIPGLETPVKRPQDVNMIVFRENTEDVYAGIEFEAGSSEAARLAEFLQDELKVAKIPENAALGLKPMSEKNSKRLVARAIEYALSKNLPSVTLVHKGNIMKFTEGGFRKWGYEVAKENFPNQTRVASDIPDGKLLIKDRIADAMFQEALLHPREYSVLATPNLNGDYLSDALAAQIGGLGLAPGVNMSDSLSFFEATHGTAPAIAGKDRANPGSFLLSAAMMLEQMGEQKASSRIRDAVVKSIQAGKVTEDLALQIEGSQIAGCSEFAEIVGSNL